MEIVSRQAARALGINKYFTGLPCVRGHIDERYVSTYQCVTCITNHCKEWQPANRAALNEAKRAWRAANPEKQRAMEKRAYAKDKEKILSRTRNRNARKRNSVGSHTAKDVANLLKKQKGKCANCLCRLEKYHVDHIVAIANGGSNSPENLQCLCPPCNIKKSDKDPIAWANENGRLI